MYTRAAPRMGRSTYNRGDPKQIADAGSGRARTRRAPRPDAPGTLYAVRHAPASTTLGGEVRIRTPRPRAPVNATATTPAAAPRPPMPGGPHDALSPRRAAAPIAAAPPRAARARAIRAATTAAAPCRQRRTRCAAYCQNSCSSLPGHVRLVRAHRASAARARSRTHTGLTPPRHSRSRRGRERAPGAGPSATRATRAPTRRRHAPRDHRGRRTPKANDRRARCLI